MSFGFVSDFVFRYSNLYKVMANREHLKILKQGVKAWKRRAERTLIRQLGLGMGGDRDWKSIIDLL